MQFFCLLKQRQLHYTYKSISAYQIMQQQHLEWRQKLERVGCILSPDCIEYNMLKFYATGLTLHKDQL